MKKNVRGSLRLIDENDYGRIHESALRVLSETGMVLPSSEAVELLKKHGAKVEGETVYFPRALVNEVLSDLPRTYRFRSRNPKRDLIIGKDLAVQNNAGTVYIQDQKKGRRQASLKDFANIMKLSQASDVFNVVCAHTVDPSDVPVEYKHLYAAYEMFKNTDKPYLGYCMTGEQSRQFLDMADIAFGCPLGTKHDEPTVSVSLNPLSPLRYSGDSLDTMFEYCRRGQAIYVFPHIMGGLTGPIHDAGMAVVENSEILASIVLIRLINHQVPVVYSGSCSAVHMRNLRIALSFPDLYLASLPLCQMAHEFYHIPTRFQCGMSDAKTLDMQCGLDAMEGLMLGMLSDVDFIVQGAGMLDAGLTTSYEMMMIMEEAIRRVKYIVDGVDFGDEFLSGDIIKEVGHSDDYIGHDSTYEYYRESSYMCPDIALNGAITYEEWAEAGSSPIDQRAYDRAAEILKAAPDTLLEAGTDADLRKYMDGIIK